jgi:hypothetical protein
MMRASRPAESVFLGERWFRVGADRMGWGDDPRNLNTALGENDPQPGAARWHESRSIENSGFPVIVCLI